MIMFNANDIEQMLKKKSIVKGGIFYCIYGTTLLKSDDDATWESVIEKEDESLKNIESSPFEKPVRYDVVFIDEGGISNINESFDTLEEAVRASENMICDGIAMIGKTHPIDWINRNDISILRMIFSKGYIHE